MKRLIIKIDEEKCTGCALCVPSCAEGALQIVDGKARLVSETYCDGLGACLGACPEGALTVEEKEAQPFDAEATEAYLASLKTEETMACGCPSSSERVLERPVDSLDETSPPASSQLAHWPVQLRLVSPQAPFLRESDLLVAADCVPFAYADFHRNLLKGHSLVVGCPKLDDSDAYIKKLASIITLNNLRSITVAHMEVGCCFGLTYIVREAVKQSGTKIPIQSLTVSVNGSVEADD